MISTFLKKARKAFWVMGQPLTKKPANPKSVVSDLFVWRCGQNWNTYFELLDVSNLFGDNEQHQVAIVFFDDAGNEFYQQSIELIGAYRQALDISKVLLALNELPSDYGTFCVFHQQVPEGVSELESFIAERGYVSYQYKKAPLRSYVHGNLDAIDGTLTPLSGSSFLDRKYNLQYLLESERTYEVALINASSNSKKVEFKIVGFDGSTQMHEYVALSRKQVLILPIKNLSGPSQLIIKSKMIMARPIVFCFNKDKIDVFHG